MKLAFDLLHNCIAHPLMALCRYHALAVRFHDWTARGME